MRAVELVGSYDPHSDAATVPYDHTPDLASLTKARLREKLIYADNMLRTRVQQSLPPAVQHALELHKMDLIHRAELLVKWRLLPAASVTGWDNVSVMVAPIAALRRAIMVQRYIDVLPAVARRLGLSCPSGSVDERHEMVIQIFCHVAAKYPGRAIQIIPTVCRHVGLDPVGVSYEITRWGNGAIPASILDLVAAVLVRQGWAVAQRAFIMDILASDFRDLALVHNGEDPLWVGIMPALRQIIALAATVSKMRQYDMPITVGFDVQGLIQHMTAVATGEAERPYRRLFHGSDPAGVF